MKVRFSVRTPMTVHLGLLILSGLAASAEPGLDDVFFSPRDQNVTSGGGVFFQCVSGDSSPPADITWLRDGTPLTTGRHTQGEYGGGNQRKTSGTLHLFNVTVEDDGIYVCVTHNPSLNISKRSRAAKLTVQGVPLRLQIVRGPDNITVATGTEASMHCTVRGFPVPMVHWFKDGCVLSDCSSSFSLQNKGQLLTFRNVTVQDEGSYHCEASNHRESVRSQPAFLLPAEMDWSFVRQPENLTVRRGDNVTLSCRPPPSRPAAQVSWFKNNRLLVPTDRDSVLPTGDLLLLSVQEEDGGSFFCRASNLHLQRFLTSRRATLTVLAPPSVKLWPQVLTVPVGARVVLQCQASGRPPPSISWMKRGSSKQTGGKILSGLRNSTLYIQSARSYDEGVYVCEASNSLGHSRDTALLRVAVSPIIVTFVGQLSCRIGASVVLPCRAVGILPIRYTWTWGRAERQTPIRTTEGRHVDEGGALHISSVQFSDVGEYYCTAENRAGRHQRRSVLTVTAEHRPADRGEQTRRVLSASNSPLVSQSSDPTAERHLETTDHPGVQAQHKEATCSLSHCDATTNQQTPTFPTFSRGAVAELKMPPRPLGRVLQHRLNQPTTNPTQPLVTQMQPPMLPPPPHPNFQAVDLHTQTPPTTDPLYSQTAVGTSHVLGTTLQYLHFTSSHSKFERQASDELLIEPDSQDSNIGAVFLATQVTELSTLPVSEHFGSLQLHSYLQNPIQNPATQTKAGYSSSVTQSFASESELHRPQELVTKSPFYRSYHEPTSTESSQTKLEHPDQHLQHQESSPTLPQIPQSDPQGSFIQSLDPKFHLEISTAPNYLPFTQPPVTKPQQFQTQGQLLPAKPTSTTSSLPQTSPTQNPLPHSQAPPPQTETFPLQHRNPLKTKPSVSTSRQMTNPSTLNPQTPGVHRANISDQVQLSQIPQSDPQESFTQSLYPKFHLEILTVPNDLPSTQPPRSPVTNPQQFQTQGQPSPAKPTSTTSSLPQTSLTQHPLLHSQAPLPQTETLPLQHRKNLKTNPSVSIVRQTSDPSTLNPGTLAVHQVNMSDQVQLLQIPQSDPQESFTHSLDPKFHLEISTVPNYLPSTKVPVTNPQQFQTQRQPSTAKPTSTTSSLPQTSPTQHPLLHSQAPRPQTEAFPLQPRNPIKTKPSVSSFRQTSDPSTLNPGTPVVDQANMSNQVHVSQIPQSDPQESFTQSLYPKFHLEKSTVPNDLPSTQPPRSPVTNPQQFQTQGQPSPTKPTSTTSSLPQTSPTQHPLLHSQAPPPQTETFPLQPRNPLKTKPSVSTVRQTSNLSTLNPGTPVVDQANMSNQVQLNTSQKGDPVQSAKSANDTELTEWLKRNTSQSPMTSNDPRVTQQSPSWLPVLEKHDIPIVVGVGVSLAFIFITVTFYSVVQKNEAAPTSRAAQRNIGVPVRHAERRAAGRTYENRAFEDDDCVAVIEQSPNTSDTQARPPGPSLVTVQMEPTCEDLQEDTPPTLDNHSVIVETYPEPVLDTKIDPSLDEEKGCSVSQPSIQLQCAEDWTSTRGDDRSPCQDALPPPSSLPSRSPSPSPPSRREEGLRSSLTLQSAEACGAPIHHSLSISHGNPPLLLSHHVSLGLTTVAVDVHFYPAATASMAVGTSTHINSPLFSPSLANSQDSHDQSTARFQK